MTISAQGGGQNYFETTGLVQRELYSSPNVISAASECRHLRNDVIIRISMMSTKTCSPSRLKVDSGMVIRLGVE